MQINQGLSASALQNPMLMSVHITTIFVPFYMASMLFGSEFAVERVRLRRRQGEVAKHAGIDASYLAGIESGRRKAPGSPTLDVLLATLNANEATRRRLRTLALIDRMLDVADGYEPGDVPVARVVKLLTQLANFGEKEWRSMEWAVSTLEHQRNLQEEEFK